MSNGVTAMYDDAEEYEALAKHFNVKVKQADDGLWWPYNMDSDHYEELKKRYRDEQRT